MSGRAAHDYEELDKAALFHALLALKTCPACRGELAPVAFCEDVWGCPNCRETWHVPVGDRR